MIKNQLIIFLIFALSGIIISMIFDFFRAIRKTTKTSNFIIYIEDCLFWIISGIILIFEIAKFSYGELRLYIFVGLIIGSLIYFFFLSKWLLKLFVNTLSIIINSIIKIKTFIKKNLYFPIKNIFQVRKKNK